ncbi:ABC transporter substrate-binding protein [Microlunatus soli]|uniref:Peptide/nickel transport system substrate-binding protein n=1 Tax=Microlunatus soli TaxID=630515 RepID=A0A1H1TXL7_9ACTN|nr:ABC transporter substrate-binding protein [Microlunatus soli]SDS64970.1 peptide/nickel transport system substrate-binding protein [Microlunatus soli]
MSMSVSRRQILLGSASVTGLAALSGCSFFSTDPDRGTDDGPKQAKGKEAPMLAAKVKSGDLPAVAERLPKNPRVITPLQKVGIYGGTLRTVLESTDPSWLWMTVTNDHLVTWDPTYSKIIENVAEKFEVLENGRVYVFHLREGMRWSDGEPFTSEDLTWWYENVLLQKELTPVIPSALKIGDEPVKVTADGPLKVTFTFPSPQALFLQQLTPHGPPFWLLPQHYLKKFHKKFNPDLPKDWSETFLAKIDQLENVDLPVVSAWVPKNPHGDGGRQLWERNPYYWKVDTDGSQLPYVDEVAFTFFNEPNPLLLSAANGDVDLYMRQEVTIPKNRPVLSGGQETGKYKLVGVKDSNHNSIGICLNLTSKDSAKRAMYRNKDFRIGLSYAIDRQQIINLVYQRQGRPWQTAPRPEVPFYTGDEFGTQYTQFDLDKAAQHLATAGYEKKNSAGKLIGEDGKPIVISILCQARYPDMIDALQFIKATWAKVGIELRIDTASPELVSERLTANDYDCTLDKGELGYVDLVADPRWLFATGGSSYAPLWSNWYEGGSPREAPPEAMQKQMSIYREKVIGSADQKTQYAALKEISEIAKDEFWTMGVSLPGDPFCIVSDRTHNVPGDDQMWLSFKAPYPAVTNVTAYYLDPQS